MSSQVSIEDLPGTKWTKTTAHAHLQNGTDHHTYYFCANAQFVYVRIETEAIPFATTDRYLSFATGSYSYSAEDQAIQFVGDEEPSLERAREVIGQKTYHYADMTPIRGYKASVTLSDLASQFRKQKQL